MSKFHQPIEAGRAFFASVLCLLSCVLLAPSAQAAATITDVKAAQRYPWNGKVDIEYTASNVESAAKADGYVLELKVTAVDRATTPWTTNVATKTALSGDLSLADGTHTLVWDLDAQGLSLKSTNVLFAVLGEVAGVQLWKAGPYWATCNVGATKPEEYGYYFWWGDTVGYKYNATDRRWDSVDGKTTGFLFKDDNTTIATYDKDIAALKTAGYIDDTGNLVAAHDAATQYLGAPWRMPTDEEMADLVIDCTTAWTDNWKGTGVSGYIVTGIKEYASRSIFLPATGYGDDSNLGAPGSRGYYWSSTPKSGSLYSAWRLLFDSFDYDLSGYWRYHGRSVRPLRGFAK